MSEQIHVQQRKASSETRASEEQRRTGQDAHDRAEYDHAVRVHSEQLDESVARTLEDIDRAVGYVALQAA